MWAKQKGFTIVELLIVIVVIAILAAITVVAFNGVQVRAENAKTVSAVRAYEKALRQYALENSAYPATGAMCLGEEYDVLNGTTAGCRQSNSVIANTANAASRNNLRPYLSGNLPMPSKKILVRESDGLGFVGIYLYGTGYNYTHNGDPVVALWYTIEDSTCPVGPVYSTAGSPNFTGDPVARTLNRAANISGCMMLLPDASKL